MPDSPQAYHMQRLCDRFMLQPMHRFWQQKKAPVPDFIISYFPYAQCAAHNGMAMRIGACIFMTVNATWYISISISSI